MRMDLAKFTLQSIRCVCECTVLCLNLTALVSDFSKRFYLFYCHCRHPVHVQLYANTDTYLFTYLLKLSNTRSVCIRIDGILLSEFWPQRLNVSSR